MVSKKLNIDSIIDDGIYKGKKLSSIANDKKKIFRLISEGYVLPDDVLEKTGIKKKIRDVKVETVIVEHEKDNKVYAKETVSLSKILKDLETTEKINQFYDSDNDGVLKDLSN